MALADSDLMGLTSEVEVIPSKTSGVSVSTIPSALVSLLEKQTPEVLDKKDKEIILRLAPAATDPASITAPEAVAEDADKATKAAYDQAVKEHAQTVKEASEAWEKAVKEATDKVKQLCLYAAAWGKGQEPKLYIHKVMNRKDMPAYHARLAVQTWDKVPAENRPGRREG